PGGDRSSARAGRDARRRRETRLARARRARPPGGARPCGPAARPRARSGGRSRTAPSRPARPRRDRRAAGRTRRRTVLPLLPLQGLAPDLDLVALARAGGLQRGLELLGLWRPPGDAKAAVGPEDPPRAARGLRAVDEEVDQRLLFGHELLQRGRRAELEEPALQLVDPGAGRRRDAEDADDPVV